MESIWGNIFRDRKSKQDVTVELLANVPLFDGLTERQLGKVKELVHNREYQPDEVVFRQGVPGFGMYVIRTGTVSIMHEPSGLQLAELGEGEFFGELALLANAPRVAAAVAKTRCVLLGFFHSDLDSLIKHDPGMGAKIAMNLAGVIGERLKKANDQLLCMMDKDRDAESRDDGQA